MSISILSNPQIKRLLNIASISDNVGAGGLTSINTSSSGSFPNSSGLTTTVASGVATLTNTTAYFNDVLSGSNTRDLTQNLNQYINIYSRSANAPTPATFNLNIGGNGTVPTGSFISIHIDGNVLATDVFVIQAGTTTTSVPNAVGPGNITCSAGNTYTFICFQGGIWTKM